MRGSLTPSARAQQKQAATQHQHGSGGLGDDGEIVGQHVVRHVCADGLPVGDGSQELRAAIDTGHPGLGRGLAEAGEMAREVDGAVPVDVAAEAEGDVVAQGGGQHGGGGFADGGPERYILRQRGRFDQRRPRGIHRGTGVAVDVAVGDGRFWSPKLLVVAGGHGGGAGVCHRHIQGGHQVYGGFGAQPGIGRHGLGDLIPHARHLHRAFSRRPEVGLVGLVGGARGAEGSAEAFHLIVIRGILAGLQIGGDRSTRQRGHVGAGARDGKGPHTAPARQYRVGGGSRLPVADGAHWGVRCAGRRRGAIAGAPAQQVVADGDAPPDAVRFGLAVWDGAEFRIVERRETAARSPVEVLHHGVGRRDHRRLVVGTRRPGSGCWISAVAVGGVGIAEAFDGVIHRQIQDGQIMRHLRVFRARSHRRKRHRIPVRDNVGTHRRSCAKQQRDSSQKPRKWGEQTQHRLIKHLNLL